MAKDIELLKELKKQFVEAMTIESQRPLLDVNAINKCGGYIRALSNAIETMKEAENDTEN
ncbi:hypothetical protein [Streptococcus suis]|uniref:hypothetical protein n=1 Tax=Streptococcus suis TaxID=1307 RepID=UPI001ABDCDA7|nr:hypothetical protein [Streptococcus suis]